MNNTKMQLTTDFGSDWWNDSCDLIELQDAVDQGAVGATSNPVIVKMVVENKPDEWLPVIDGLISENPNGTEDDITWALVDDHRMRPYGHSICMLTDRGSVFNRGDAICTTAMPAGPWCVWIISWLLRDVM